MCFRKVTLMGKGEGPGGTRRSPPRSQSGRCLPPARARGEEHEWQDSVGQLVIN